jgi:methylated-DNA-protein-cysteine methyltransferase-like protein
MNRFQFYQDVYSIVAEIPFGRVLSYGQIARLAGKPQCSRMVGQAMFHAPEELHLPCHRVVNSQGRLAPSWIEQKSLLEAEGVHFKKNGMVDMERSQWNPIEELGD